MLMKGTNKKMSSESDKEWIERFNRVSRKSYYYRYKEMFKPSSAISSMVLPSDRHEIIIGLNHFTKEDKEKVKSMEETTDQVQAIITIMEEPVAYFYNIMQQDFIEKAMEYYTEGLDFSKQGEDSRNIGIQLVNHVNLFCDDEFSFADAAKIIDRNQKKYAEDFKKRLLGSLVPILVEEREDRKMNEDIHDIVEDFMKHDLDMIVLDVATERQRQEWTK